jgi:hypothetical protein
MHSRVRSMNRSDLISHRLSLLRRINQAAVSGDQVTANVLRSQLADEDEAANRPKQTSKLERPLRNGERRVNNMWDMWLSGRGVVNVVIWEPPR